MVMTVNFGKGRFLGWSKFNKDSANFLRGGENETWQTFV
jgi:hypothetical protein